MSDLVILLGVRRLLCNSTVGQVTLPFSQYDVKLGIEAGNDVTAESNDLRLVGEAFNVAPSFFQTKKATTLKKLRQDTTADYRLLIFNEDAARNPQGYVARSSPDMTYLPIDLRAELGLDCEERGF